MEEIRQYDAVIVGGGPAGLSAAIYMARARYSALVLEKETFGGQITITSEVVNYPGVPKTSGRKLTEEMKAQAESFGAVFQKAEVYKMKRLEDVWILETSAGLIRTIGVILAVGARPRTIGFPGEDEWKGRGVAYCATCDGEFFTGKEVFVIGGGYAAAEEAMFLTRYARIVRLMVRGSEMSCARSIVEAVERHPGIEIHYETEITRASGDGILNRVEFWDEESGRELVYQAEEGEFFGVFVFAGYEPASGWLKGIVALDEKGYILTGPDQKTDQEGVYAAGDVCIKPLRQVVTAVSDGAQAATALEKYVSGIREKMGLPKVPELTRTEEVREKRTRKEDEGKDRAQGIFFDADMRQQMMILFERFAGPVQVIGKLKKGSTLSDEMDAFMEELVSFADPVRYERTECEEEHPVLEIRTDKGGKTGIFFYGVPGGHEINSFLSALYNTAGPGKEVPEKLKERICRLSAFDLEIFVSLSCTMCPEMVMGAQKMASLHPEITASMLDLQHFPIEKEKYRILSVPCMVVDGKETIFGKKSLVELVEALEQIERQREKR